MYHFIYPQDVYLIINSFREHIYVTLRDDEIAIVSFMLSGHAMQPAYREDPISNSTVEKRLKTSVTCNCLQNESDFFCSLIDTTKYF
jgi:hypothetical protein